MVGGIIILVVGQTVVGTTTQAVGRTAAGIIIQVENNIHQQANGNIGLLYTKRGILWQI